MISIKIPNRAAYNYDHLVLDYNGTLAIDGIPIEEVSALLAKLAQKLTVHVITADTFGSVSRYFNNTNIHLKIISGKEQAKQKAEFVNSLNPKTVIAIGNGANDGQMLKTASLGIALIQAEGASLQALTNADIVCTSIADALNLVINPRRISATLRE
ncbi:MAG TPA: ATPase P [Bacteroidetes bacterium]|nr:ATPase P [Bacteroidota bacterium]